MFSNIEKPKIVATIGKTFNEKNLPFFERLIDRGITDFRFNLSKQEDNKSLSQRMALIKLVDEMYKDDIKIMLDLPYPGRKPRISLKKSQEKVDKGELLLITSEKVDNEDGCYKKIFLDVNELAKKMKGAKTIFYSDGECSFEIVDIIDENTVLVKSNETQVIYNGKSLSWGYVNKRVDIDDEYINIVKSVKAENIALSFVTNKSEVIKFKEYFPEQNVISKIESELGIERIDEISQETDIMLGRGDLCLNSDYYNLFNNQKTVAEWCKRNNRKFYIATGILTSLCRSSRISQADIIDVSNMFMLNPDYLVFNYSLILDNCELALQAVDHIYDNL